MMLTSSRKIRPERRCPCQRPERRHATVVAGGAELRKDEDLSARQRRLLAMVENRAGRCADTGFARQGHLAELLSRRVIGIDDDDTLLRCCTM